MCLGKTFDLLKKSSAMPDNILAVFNQCYEKALCGFMQRLENSTNSII